MAELVASQLSCMKRDKVLFESLSLSLSPGQLVHLRGPNGAGKTSLLRILAGLSQPDTGTVTWNNRAIDNEFQRRLVYLGHKAGLSAGLSAIENLTFWCAQHHIRVSETTLFEVLEVLSLVGLEEIPVRLLSAGQQRRVALARLWLKSSDIWILDEPFTALDTDGVALIQARCETFVRQGGAVIVTSHQPLSMKDMPVSVIELEGQL
ncbi:cytochrome c biogenesis heme-transporting ATPase CcmA [Salinimonas sp. HHU 13199]|uniref:Cytochrome c biogenesis heme-transporting ATPase CcmA n=2 Tax=Salinimonas profundi TaxID=2729140 RepID=A0ABR8LMY1_9ALTE|nr:cytochrome c biogenesis heme-transporting ATPase CcmA [Salinimonas profundi]MBD3585439.1 cytochrome c biogenesis heme-transporting ATPase CcmA [Salinimonas profundi]